MTASDVSLDSRIARIEGEMQHVATKADVERLRAEMQRGLLALGGGLGTLIIAAVGAILAALRLWA